MNNSQIKLGESLAGRLPDLEQHSEDINEGVSSDPWQSTGAQKFLEAILEAKEGSRYPKEGDNVFQGDAAHFLQTMPNAFVLALDRLKKEAGKSRKRKSDVGIDADEAEE